jgi:hypothetical protein
MNTNNRCDTYLRTSGVRRLPVEFDGMKGCNVEHMKGLLSAGIDILKQGEGLLRSLSSENYTRRVPLVFNASIGGHYRHCLDHFTGLLLAPDTDEVDYDRRRRDLRVETLPEFALALTVDIRRALEQFPPETLCSQVRARCEVSYTSGNSAVTASTLAREVVYCIAHAIHHYALICVMAKLLNVRVPEHFGVAPSTLAYERAVAAEQGRVRGISDRGMPNARPPDNPGGSIEMRRNG